MVEKIQITCLINDTVKWDKGFWGEHGISFLIELPDERILFDTGTSPQILEHNLNKINTDLKEISAVVLSHGHYDHTGALEWVLSKVDYPRVIADPLVFDQKLIKKEDGGFWPVGSPMKNCEVEKKADLHLTTELTEIADGVFVTGRIPRNTSFEKTPENYYRETKNDLHTDTIPDDRTLVILSAMGLLVVCGCCHAGLINTLTYITDHFKKPIHAVMGGIHLVGASEERIQETLRGLQNIFKPDHLYLNHCTGFDALTELRLGLGDIVQPFLAADVLEFDL